MAADPGAGHPPTGPDAIRSPDGRRPPEHLGAGRMTALDAVSVHLPQRRVPIESLAGPLGLTEMQVRLFRRFHGLDQVRRDPDLSLHDLLLGAATGLTALRGQEHRVRFVLYGRAFPVVVPYPANPLHDVCRALGLGHAVALTLTQQSCASALLAIELAGRLLAAEPADRPGPGEGPLALVLTGEKAFTRDAEFIPETSIFSEGASACLVSTDGPRDRLLGYACAQRGEFDVAGGASGAQFQREYRPALAEVIGRALAEAGVALDDVRLVLPHNVNVVTWQRLCRLLGFPRDRVLLDNVRETGHVFCADAFVNYRTACERGLLQPGDHYLVAAVGAGDGATFAAMVFTH
ncbi:3-oxoacyl-[acyl-carrier-protein] synthase III C-terminal domain-containing protein [Micromonospora sp. WMMD714]|uniref:3-oxoacyl-[acyl-carrier-protein] synthase III C-terminal domain-containing protein n=1 Tax=Micromonospora sp. WMMD714 TaxID=3016097 RepID=UPI00249CDAB4|nr:3-oxoacyl-[acyl-carrier-protein] synthase III C-terminal domain-containing protein [Micromonospora sp. WMMD714]WFE64813.1 3-oxoacyl-[acyl-carrier-protein] synthase III C-terminal domain-containing protein [Micromonospora sp. WMMD714]